MLKYLIKIANDLDERGLSKEADFLDNLINKAAFAIDNAVFADDDLSPPKEGDASLENESDLTSKQVEEDTASGSEAFFATLNPENRALLERLELDEAAVECAETHLRSHRDGNAKDSYLSFIDCVLNAEQMDPDLQQDADILKKSLESSLVAPDQTGSSEFDLGAFLTKDM
jgi:hypothetical protein